MLSRSSDLSYHAMSQASSKSMVLADHGARVERGQFESRWNCWTSKEGQKGHLRSGLDASESLRSDSSHGAGSQITDFATIFRDSRTRIFAQRESYFNGVLHTSSPSVTCEMCYCSKENLYPISRHLVAIPPWSVRSCRTLRRLPWRD